MQKKPTPKSASKKIDYEYAGKESLDETIAKAFPKQLVPTKRMGPILGWIFLAVVIIALIQFPLGQMLAGNINIIISVGYPLPFLEFSLIDTEGLPVLPVNLILDIMLYVIVAYIIDITLGLILNNPLMKNDKQKKQRPVIFKNKNPTMSEKLTKKVFEKSTK